MVIRPDDTIVVRVARSEMGQGTLTGLAQLVVEELEGDWSKVTTESITAAQNLARNRVWGEMGTGGSRGIRISQDYVRRGGAAARLMLLQAAADAWKVPVAEVSVAKGVVTHAASGRSTTYGKLAEAASRLTPPDPKDIKLKDPKDWTIAGKPLARLDTADKLDGRKVYAIDVRLPGMLNAAIKHCPVYGGKLDRYDEAQGGVDAGRARGREGLGLRPSRSSPTPGGGQRPRSRRCRSSGTRGRAPRRTTRRSPSTCARA